MNDLFFVLLLLTFMGLVGGIAKPALVKQGSRKRVLGIFGGGLILFAILFGATSSTKTEEDNIIDQSATQTTPKTTPKQTLVAPLSLERQVEQKIIAELGEKTNMGKPTIISVKTDKYTALELQQFGHKQGEEVFEVMVKVNASENVTSNLTKQTMHKEAFAIFKNVFPLSPKIGDVLVWSYIPTKDQYGNMKSDVGITYSMARSLFSKVNWGNMNYSELPALLKAENKSNPLNNYVELIKF